MKTIQLRDDEKLKTRDVLRVVLEKPGGQTGIGVDEMRRRIRILDKLEKASEKLELEDADYELIKNLYDGFQFAVVDRTLVQISDDLATAK